MIKNYFITVNYNNSEHTIKYIDSILSMDSYDKDSARIIVVDNNSKYEEIIKIEEKIESLEGIQLVKSNINLGYFPALNKGIEIMENKKGSYAIVGNNDMVFQKDFLTELKRLNFSASTYVLAPRIVASDGYCQNPYHINRISKFRKIAYRLYYSNYYVAKLMTCLASKYRLDKEKDNFRMKYNEQMEIYMGHGSCYVLTPNFFEHFGKLDDRVFLWGEEALLTGQIATKKGVILYTPSIYITHNRSSSTNKLPTREKYNIMKKSYKIYAKYL